MAQDLTQDLNAFTQMVKGSLQKAQKQVSNLRKTNTGLIIGNIVCSSAATLIAGVTAAAGPIVGEGPSGWRTSCILAAILAFVSTVSTGFVQQLKFEERLMNGHQCVNRLRELDLMITTGSSSWDDISNEYRDIARNYPDHIG
jgi:hypothetical protein